MANATSPSRLEESSRRVARVCAAIAIAVGALVLAGWAFDVAILTRLWPPFAPMAPNTALCFVLVGIALWPLAGRDPPDRSRAAAVAAGAIVAILGLLTLIEYATASSLGIDELVFKDPRGSVETLAPGRMAIATAANILLFGIAVALMAARRAHRTVQALCLLPCTFSLLALAGHLYGVRALYSIRPFTGIALHTVLTTIVVGVGLLASHRGHGVTAVLTSETIGGAMVRGILPAAIAIPLVVGWFVRKGRVADLYPSEVGASLLVVSSIVLISFVILWQGAALGRIDRDRIAATGAASQASETLRKLSRAVEQSPASVVITDTKGDIEYVNPKFTQVTGFNSDEVLGMNPRILKSGELSPEVYRELWETITAGREWNGEFHNRRKSGEAFWEMASISPIFDDEKRITGFVGVSEDVTERKRGEEALRFRNLLLSTLSEVSPDAILVVDRDREVVHFNTRFLGMWGVPPEVARAGDDEPVLRLVLEKVADPVAFHERVTHLYDHPEDTGHDEVALKDGRTIERYSAPMDGPDGSHYGRVWYFRDATERHALEGQLRQSQKMEAVGRLAGGIAHDFNNLLTAILGYSELMEEELPHDENLRSSLHEIQKAGERAASLTRQLLAFSRKQVLQPLILDLNGVVSEMEKMLRRLIGEDVTLMTRLDPALDRVKADPSQIEQVLMNLAVNARDAMPEGGTLTIETANATLDATFVANHRGARAGEYVSFTISDTGTGMTADVLSHAFEPFFTTREVGKGTGLGLSTVLGIVKQSGGYITVDSEPGRGTTFRAYFPRVGGDADSSASGPRTPIPPGSGETILLVDDEPSLRKLSRKVLESNGYTVLDAASGDEALALAHGHGGEIHLLVTDVIMSGMNGRVLWDRLRAVRPKTGILFISGYTDDTIGRHGVLEPGTPFLQKPFTPRSLTKKIREVLEAGAE